MSFCDPEFDGLGMQCRRCGSWKRGTDSPTCPPYITRSEPDGKRLPNIKTQEENTRAWVTWSEYEDAQHPWPAEDGGIET